jgi:hypothetical protein
MAERVRAKAEIEQIEREAMWRAQFQPVWRLRLPKLFSFRRAGVEKRSTATVRQISAEC